MLIKYLEQKKTEDSYVRRCYPQRNPHPQSIKILAYKKTAKVSEVEQIRALSPPSLILVEQEKRQKFSKNEKKQKGKERKKEREREREKEKMSFQ